MLSDECPRGCGDKALQPDAHLVTETVTEGNSRVKVAVFKSKRNKDCHEHDATLDGGHRKSVDPNVALPLMVSALHELALGEFFFLLGSCFLPSY